jgi:hypothetical protein
MEDRPKLDLGKSQRAEVEELKKNKRISRGEPTAAAPPCNNHRCLFTGGNEFALDQVIGGVGARPTEALRLNDA